MGQEGRKNKGTKKNWVINKKMEPWKSDFFKEGKTKGS
jgi:hypothetical protein